MEASTSKRRCLASLAGTKFVTDAALSAVLRAVSNLELDVKDLGKSRWSISRAVGADLSIPTMHGQVLSEIDLPLIDGTVYKWTIVEPSSLLCWLCQFSPGFQEALAATHERTPSNRKFPWSIIVYLDEATPGNMLDQDVTRKSWCFYWQFQEMGPELLSRDEMWLVGGILRSSVVKKVLGGASGVFKHFVAQLFQPNKDFRKGVCVNSGRTPFLITATLETVLADEAALKAIWHTKGASGLKPCMHCMNVCGARSDLEGGSFVSVSCHMMAKFKPYSDATLWEAADKLVSFEKPG